MKELAVLSRLTPKQLGPPNFCVYTKSFYLILLGNVQQATQLYTQQQQFINQFGQQAENIRTSESQAIKDRVG